ncbi:MAG: CGNR zinc finger domain-containing protein [Actinomycetota bacterium]
MQEVTPEAPALVKDFLNTLDIESGSDGLDSPAALRRWIETRLGARSRSVDEDAWRAVIETRESLREVLASHSGSEPNPDSLARLNRAGRSAQITPHWDDEGRATFEPHEGGAYGALGRILAAVVASQSDGTWDRLKVCSAENCRYAFYDHSKNRSGRWCEMRVCGNRAKTRTYRQRHG